eukprot:COSAG02_NODE_10343_length_1963_cov_20.945684_2_plen_101_part_01
MISAPSSATPGASVTVTLAGTTAFKGFLLRSAGASISGMPSNAKSKYCSGYTAAATHTSGAFKTSLDFTITMPTSGSVTISGLVQVSYGLYHNLASVTIFV